MSIESRPKYVDVFRTRLARTRSEWNPTAHHRRDGRSAWRIILRGL